MRLEDTILDLERRDRRLALFESLVLGDLLLLADGELVGMAGRDGEEVVGPGAGAVQAEIVVDLEDPLDPGKAHQLAGHDLAGADIFAEHQHGLFQPLRVVAEAAADIDALQHFVGAFADAIAKGFADADAFSRDPECHVFPHLLLRTCGLAVRMKERSAS